MVHFSLQRRLLSRLQPWFSLRGLLFFFFFFIKDWRMLQIFLPSPTPSFSILLSQAACRCLYTDPGIFMICVHHARFLAGKPSFRPACLGPNERGSSGDSGGAVRPSRATGRRIHERMDPGVAVWVNRRRLPGKLAPERRLNWKPWPTRYWKKSKRNN